MIANLLLIITIVLLIIISGLFSGSEIGMYRMSRLRLRLGVEKRNISFGMLEKCINDTRGLLLTILIGNNLTHYLITSIATVLILRQAKTEHYAEIIATIITAPLIFIFAELIPKNIFFYRADYLMPLCAPFLFILHKTFTFTAVISLFKSFANLFAKIIGLPASAKNLLSDASEHYIKAVIRETKEEAFLTTVQTDIIDRVVSIPHISLGSVMTPLAKVHSVPKNTDASTLLKELRKHSFTRMLVFEYSPSNIIGFVNIYHALNSNRQFSDLSEFIRPIPKLYAYTPVPEAIEIMKKEHQKIALVTKHAAPGKEKPIGIVTMKDLVEELLGELVEW